MRINEGEVPGFRVIVLGLGVGIRVRVSVRDWVWG